MNAIILCGGWDGHQPKLISERFKKMLLKENFEVEIIYSLEEFAKIHLKKYDVIVPLWTMAEDKPINKTVIKNISDAVFAGVGLASCHGGIIDAFRQSTNWQYMTGAQWVYHGKQRTYKVKYYDDDNMFTSGLNEFSVMGEQYYVHIDPAAKVHAYSDYPNGDDFLAGNGEYHMPVIITKNYGKGKVFVFTVGHQDHEFDIPEASEIMRRGLLWASNIDKPVLINTKTLKAVKAEALKTFKPVDKTNGKLKVAVIGCGNISGVYFKNLTSVFNNVEVIGCYDLIREKAENAQAKYNLSKTYGSDIDACKDPDVDIILNITQPKAHYELSKLALTNGKHVYVEKPLALSLAQGKELLELAASKNLYIGGAPDTFLGTGIQTAVKAIDMGIIGKPIAATAFLTCRGHESWHPSPEFYYEEGGGPMLDMGPYYITALIAMLGEAVSIIGYGNISFAERTITSKPKNGKTIKIETPTHITGVIKFKSGALATVITSFDVHAATLPIIEIYGSNATMKVPNPNNFSGKVQVSTGKRSKRYSFTTSPPYVDIKKVQKFKTIKAVNGYFMNSRGLGLSDMASAIQEGREARANAKLTCHVLDIMLGFLESAKTGKEHILTTSCEKPKQL